MNLIILTELLTSSPRFKPHYIFNEHDVILNETIIFDYKVKGNKSSISNIRVEGAETVDGRWCLNCCVWYGNGGFSSPTTRDDLIDNCHSFDKAVTKVTHLIRDYVYREFQSSSSSGDKKVQSQILQHVTDILFLKNPSTIL